MKRFSTSLALILGTAAAAAQAIIHVPGRVDFDNSETARPAGTLADFHLIGSFGGSLIVGTQYQAELFLVSGGTRGVFDGSLTPIPSSISPFRPATTSLPGTWSGRSIDLSVFGIGGVDIYNDGSGEAGTDYINPATGTTLPGADGPGHYPLMFRVRVWDSSTGGDFYTAIYHGQSRNFIYTQRGSAPPLPADEQMINQPGFIFTTTPEPSLLTLSIVGAAGLVLFGRRRLFR